VTDPLTIIPAALPADVVRRTRSALQDRRIEILACVDVTENNFRQLIRQSSMQLLTMPDDVKRELLGYLQPIVAEHMPRCGVSWLNSSARFQFTNTTTPNIGWHQDYIAMEMRNSILRGVTVWIPLDPIDGTRPTMEFGAENEKGPRQHQSDQWKFAVSEYAPAGTMILKDLPAGSAVLFGPLLMHRTYIAPEMTHSRISMDIRFREGW